ncbi:MAG: nucleoside deaminase [Bacteroidales bacterium]|jgi:tRNA(adenine34) deaminase|nr:nucleoside deaminase [Bacteroidales bacterium]
MMTPEASDDIFMKAALDEAERGKAAGEVPVGAVVVCNKRIIARAHNLTETLNDPTAHAEMQAITAASGFLGGKYLDKCSLYVTLEPCMMCAGALFWSRIGTLVYGTADEKRGFTLYSRSVLHKKTRVVKGIMEEECRKIIVDFFENKRQNYTE